jgi:ABC-type sugar transport system, permease component
MKNLFAGKLAKRISNGIVVCAMALVVALIISPVLLTVISSVTSERGLSSFSIGQYWELIANGKGYFYLYLRSFMVALLITIGQVVISIIVGFLFGRFSFWGKTFLFVLYVIVLFLPYSASLLPNYIIIRTLGLLNTQAAIILPSVFMPLTVVISIIFISSLPQETFDAALLETKSIFQVIRHILLPQISPAVVLTIIISFTEAWNLVEQPQALMEDRLLHPLSLLMNSIFGGGGINYAGCMLYLVPAFILLVLFEDALSDKGIGGIKRQETMK